MFGFGGKGSKRHLHLRSAGRAVWRPQQRRLVICLVLLITLPALGWGLAWGYQRLMSYYLLESGRFVLRTIEIQAGDTITSDLVREQLQLREACRSSRSTSPGAGRSSCTTPQRSAR